MDKAVFAGIMAGIMVTFASWVFISDNKKVNLFFPWMRGGTKTRDPFGLIETVSVEVRQVGHNNAHSQSYICKLPVIEEGETRYSARGYLESVGQGRIPVVFEILKVVNGPVWTINFKVFFRAELPGVEMVKAWCWLKADRYSLIDRPGSGPASLGSLQPAPRGWVKLQEGYLGRVKFYNEAGAVQLEAIGFPKSKIEQIWKHIVHAEYVTLWVMDTDGATIEKGTVFEGSWTLEFEEK